VTIGRNVPLDEADGRIWAQSLIRKKRIILAGDLDAVDQIEMARQISVWRSAFWAAESLCRAAMVRKPRN
jgi:hypothetical protein